MFNKFSQIDPVALQEQIESANSQQEQLLEFVNTMQELLKAYLPFLLIAASVFALFFIINAINKMRVDRAILRIDKNLQKILEKENTKPHTPTYGPPGNKKTVDVESPQTSTEA